MADVVEKVEERSVEELIERFEESLRDVKEGRTEEFSSADGSR